MIKEGMCKKGEEVIHNGICKRGKEVVRWEVQGGRWEEGKWEKDM